MIRPLTNVQLSPEFPNHRGVAAALKNCTYRPSIHADLPVTHYSLPAAPSHFEQDVAAPGLPDSSMLRSVTEVPLSPDFPDHRGLAAALKICSHEGDVERMEMLLRQLLQEGAVLDGGILNSVIHTCTRAGDTGKAMFYMDFMRKCRIPPTTTTFNLMINACASLGHVDEANKWIHRMLAANVEPNEVTYSTVCKAFARTGEVTKIRQVMRGLVARGIKLNQYFYASLISACGVCEPPELALAESAFQELVKEGLPPQSVKKALVRVVGKARVEEIWKTMHKQEPKVNQTAAVPKVSQRRRGGGDRCSNEPRRGGDGGTDRSGNRRRSWRRQGQPRSAGVPNGCVHEGPDNRQRRTGGAVGHPPAMHGQ